MCIFRRSAKSGFPENGRRRSPSKDMMVELKDYMEKGGHARDYFAQFHHQQEMEAEIMLKTRQDVHDILNSGDVDGAREEVWVHLTPYTPDAVNDRAKSLVPRLDVVHLFAAVSECRNVKASVGYYISSLPQENAGAMISPMRR